MSYSHNPKILILCATGAYNLGDELILRGEVEMIRKKYGTQVQITVCTYDLLSAIDPDPDIEWISYFPNGFLRRPFANMWYFFQNLIALMRADIVIVGGGGIFFDNEKGVSFQRLVWQWLIRVSIARWCGAHIIYWGVSLEIKNLANIPKLAPLFLPSDTIFVRDQRSQSLLKTIGVDSTLVPDIVFAYQPQDMRVGDTRKKRVGISLRGGFGLHRDAVYAMLEKISLDGYEPILLTFSASGSIDHNDILFFQSFFGDQQYHITQTIEETLSLFPTLSAVVSMRLHATILSCVHEIPCIPISYGPKTDELIMMLDLSDMSIPASGFSTDAFVSRWDRIRTESLSLRERMREKHILLKDQIEGHHFL